MMMVLVFAERRDGGLDTDHSSPWATNVQAFKLLTADLTARSFSAMSLVDDDTARIYCEPVTALTREKEKVYLRTFCFSRRIQHRERKVETCRRAMGMADLLLLLR